MSKMKKPRVIVLGARLGVNNIGSAIVNEMKINWDVRAHDCSLGEGYECPPSELVRFKDADALVISLGRTMSIPFSQMSLDMDEIIHANLTLPLICASNYVAARASVGPGKIVFIGSYAHDHPFTNGTAYCAAKAGLNMAAKAIAWETTKLGFYTYVVNPFHVEGTPMWEEVQEGVMERQGITREEADAYARKDAQMELLTPGDVARSVRSILDSNGLRFASGTSIDLYGGTR